MAVPAVLTPRRTVQHLSPREVVRRYELARSDRAAMWESHWEEQATYTCPSKKGFNTEYVDGQKLTHDLYDATAVDALDQLSGTISSYFTPRGMLWSRMVTRNEALNRIDAVAEFCEESSWRLHLAFLMSTFHAESPDVYLEAAGFGTGAMLMEPRPPLFPGFFGLRFKALALARLALMTDADGKIDTAFRWFCVSAQGAVNRWGAACGDKIIRLANDRPNAPVKLLHAILPRPGGERGQVGPRKPWSSWLIALDNAHVIREWGYDRFPVYVWRWSVRADEVYGRGRSDVALPDVKTLNEAVRLDFKAWSKDIDPPALVDDEGVIGPIDARAGGVTVKRPQAQVEWWQSGSRYDVTQIKVDALQAAVRRRYYADRLPPLDQDQKIRTATEILERRALLDQLMAQPIGRGESEFLTPMLSDAIDYMLEAGALPELPPELEGEHVDFEYLGALARAARLDEALAIEQFEASLTTAMQIDPNVIDIYKGDAAQRYKARVRGVPAEILASEEEVRARREARAEQEAQAQSAAQAMQTAEGLGKVAPFIKAVSPGGTPALPANASA